MAKDKELEAQKKQRLDRRNDLRITRLFEHISSVGPLDWVWFEDVLFLSTQLQSQLWASLRAAVWLHGRGGLQIDCVPVTTLKKFATGSGNATKDMMAKALGCELIPTGLKTRPLDYKLGDRLIDDNEVDARHLLTFAKHKLDII